MKDFAKVGARLCSALKILLVLILSGRSNQKNNLITKIVFSDCFLDALSKVQ